MQEKKKHWKNEEKWKNVNLIFSHTNPTFLPIDQPSNWTHAFRHTHCTIKIKCFKMWWSVQFQGSICFKLVLGLSCKVALNMQINQGMIPTFFSRKLGKFNFFPSIVNLNKFAKIWRISPNFWYHKFFIKETHNSNPMLSIWLILNSKNSLWEESAHALVICNLCPRLCILLMG
jgi:hypothetical protein